MPEHWQHVAGLFKSLLAHAHYTTVGTTSLESFIERTTKHGAHAVIIYSRGPKLK